MSGSIVIKGTEGYGLESNPIPPAWVVEGKPEARLKLLAKSRDGTSWTLVWECTAGTFHWYYPEDETVVVISGEVFISTKDGDERRLGADDMAHFPAGTSCKWRVPDRIRKVAIMRKPLPVWMGFGVRAWHKLTRMAGLRQTSPLLQ